MVVVFISDSYLFLKTKMRKCAGGVMAILAGCGPADASSILAPRSIIFSDLIRDRGKNG